MALLEVVSISKAFGGTTVLHDVSFQVEEGEILCLLGPSGCGKTTLLRIIAGLEAADSGHIDYDGRPLDEVPVHLRGFGLMFQDFALFPHKDVASNVAFGLRMRSMSRQQIETRVKEMLVLVGLEGYERRQVYDLSGGEQQRVALARSLAPSPHLLMLDEPLGSLDRALREDLMNELQSILKQVSVTAIYVTHDQQEAFAAADRIAIMDRGHIVQLGNPQHVYHRPASPWVARFLGLRNLIPACVQSLQPPVVETALGSIPLAEIEELQPGQEAILLIRPEAARLVEASLGDESTAGTIVGLVQECSFRGGRYRVVVRPPGSTDLVFELVSDSEAIPQVGESIVLSLRPKALSLLPEEPHD